MNYEFTKSEKKIVRKVIETGLQRDFESCNRDIENIILRWESGELTNREAYLEIYGTVKKNDKYIARMYDDQRGSTYMRIIQGLLANKVISEADLVEFKKETRNDILGIQKKMIE